jgi:tRNA-specific 2-thiouridylase
MKKVYVGLSGGVDSSVAAALLKRDGYDVTGVYMKNWAEDLPGMLCPWKQDLADARAVAAKLQIPFKVFDFQNQYREKVVQYLLDEYQAGRTPNPDIMCNQEIKFKVFLEAALADGADMVATGHYARIADGALRISADDNKDQTYFLYRIDPAFFEQILFPIGEYPKPQVRELAAEFGLPTANKKDSQGICFIGKVGIKEFLSRYVDAEPGPILHDGVEIGQHEGAIFYTLGQRQGLGVGGGKPFYVTGKDMASNTVFVTDDHDDLSLDSDYFEIDDLHLFSEISDQRDLKVRLRHRGELIACRPKFISGSLSLRLSKPARAIAPGQSAVLYEGDRVLGGGIIASVRAPALR